MPVHPTTWFKIAFADGEVATFRSSALIPLDTNGKPLSGYSSQTHTTYQGKARQAKNNTNYATGGDFVGEYTAVSQSAPTSSSGRKLREPRSRANSLDEDTVTSPVRRYRSNSNVGGPDMPSKRGRGRPPGGGKASIGKYSNYPYMDPYTRYGTYNTYEGGDTGMNLQLGFSAYARTNNLNLPPRSLSLDEKSAMENAICVLLNLNEGNGNSRSSSSNSRSGTTTATINTTAGMSIKLTDTTTNESMLYSFNGSPRGQVSPEHDSFDSSTNASLSQDTSNLFSTGQNGQNQNSNNKTIPERTINPAPSVVDVSGYEEDDEDNATELVEEEGQDFFDDSSTSTISSRKRAFSTSSDATILPVIVEEAVPVPVNSSVIHGHRKGIADENDSTTHPHKKIRALSFGTDIEETDSETKSLVKRLSESALNIEGTTTININIYQS